MIQTCQCLTGLDNRLPGFKPRRQSSYEAPRAVGFDTAVNMIADALNRLTFTAASYDRVMVIEVMGRGPGH
jgi:hypothetical protein